MSGHSDKADAALALAEARPRVAERAARQPRTEEEEDLRPSGDEGAWGAAL
jgi:hypothetical protein